MDCDWGAAEKKKTFQQSESISHGFFTSEKKTAKGSWRSTDRFGHASRSLAPFFGLSPGVAPGSRSNGWEHPGRLTAGTQTWRWMVQMIFLFKWVIFRFQPLNLKVHSGSKLLVLGIVIPPLIGTPYGPYVRMTAIPYHWNLDPSKYQGSSLAKRRMANRKTKNWLFHFPVVVANESLIPDLELKM